MAEAFAEGGGGLEAEVTLEGGGISIGDGNVTGLHGDELLVGVEVVVGREDTGTEEFFLKDGDEIEEVLGVGVADVVNGIGRNGEAVLASLLLGGVLHHSAYSLHDVIDVGEVTLAVAIVEDLDGIALHEFIGETEIGHVGTAGRTIDGEETEAGGGDVIEFAVGMGQQFVALLRGGIKRDGVIDLVIGAVGDFLVGAVDAAAAGVDEVLDGVMAAGFEDVVEADEVGFDVGIGVSDAVADTGLGGEVDDDIELVLCEEGVDEVAVGDVASDKGPGLSLALPMGARDLLNFLKALFLEADVVVVVHIVDADNLGGGIVAKEELDEVAADEAGGAGHQNGGAVKIDIGI